FLSSKKMSKFKKVNENEEAKAVSCHVEAVTDVSTLKSQINESQHQTEEKCFDPFDGLEDYDLVVTLNDGEESVVVCFQDIESIYVFDELKNKLKWCRFDCPSKVLNYGEKVFVVGKFTVNDYHNLKVIAPEEDGSLFLVKTTSLQGFD
ncbi:MAG: hypothetical protein NZO16_04775, partial [Deltaproteobacteria bacterium]|nr:hypothetical protein [Deltaproteobacteria bacterium]